MKRWNHGLSKNTSIPFGRREDAQAFFAKIRRHLPASYDRLAEHLNVSPAEIIGLVNSCVHYGLVEVIGQGPVFGEVNK